MSSTAEKTFKTLYAMPKWKYESLMEQRVHGTDSKGKIVNINVADGGSQASNFGPLKRRLTQRGKYPPKLYTKRGRKEGKEETDENGNVGGDGGDDAAAAASGGNGGGGDDGGGGGGGSSDRRNDDDDDDDDGGGDENA